MHGKQLKTAQRPAGGLVPRQGIAANRNQVFFRGSSHIYKSITGWVTITHLRQLYPVMTVFRLFSWGKQVRCEDISKSNLLRLTNVYILTH